MSADATHSVLHPVRRSLLIMVEIIYTYEDDDNLFRSLQFTISITL